MTDTVKIDNFIEELGKMTISLAQIAGDLPTPKTPIVCYLSDSKTSTGAFTYTLPSGYTIDDFDEVYLEIKYFEGSDPGVIWTCYTEALPLKLQETGVNIGFTKAISYISTPIRYIWLNWGMRNTDVQDKQIRIFSFPSPSGTDDIVGVRLVGVVH